MPSSNLDPNFLKEQQQVMRMIGLKRAKKTVKTASPKKLLFILIPVFLAALALVLYTSEIFNEPYTVSWNGAIYRLPSELSKVQMSTKPEGFKFAGYLDPDEENDSANWSPFAEVYVKEGDDRVIYLYLTAPKGYYRAKKKWTLCGRMP